MASSTHSAAAIEPGSAASAGAGPRQVSVLLYSDDITTRDSVRAAAGRRPARDVEIIRWHECATAPAVTEALDAGGYDLVILDGEAAPTGGLGLCRELKNEIYNCPPVLVLTGRPQDGWPRGRWPTLSCHTRWTPSRWPRRLRRSPAAPAPPDRGGR